MKAASTLQLDDLARPAETLRVLAHPFRLLIVDRLLNERHSVGELSDEIGLAPAAVSQHLNHMRAHGILDVERRGRAAFYFVISPHARQLLACIREHAPRHAST